MGARETAALQTSRHGGEPRGGDTREAGKRLLRRRRDIRGVAALIGDEELRAAVIVWWRRRGWVAAATDAGVRLAWRSAILGRPADASFDWRELTRVEPRGRGARLHFGDQALWVSGRLARRRG